MTPSTDTVVLEALLNAIPTIIVVIVGYITFSNRLTKLEVKLDERAQKQVENQQVINKLREDVHSLGTHVTSLKEHVNIGETFTRAIPSMVAEILNKLNK